MMTTFKTSETTVRSVLGRVSHQDSLAMLLGVYAKDIARYRHHLSAKLRCDVGMDWAAVEWLNEHCPQWKRLYWDKAVAEATKDQIFAVADRIVPN